MRLCKPSYEIWEQPAGLEGIYKMIEKAGRVCYKSEDKITEDSAKSFVDRMVASGHGAMLEHGTVYLKVPKDGLLRNFIDGTPSHFNYGWCKTNPIMDEDNNVYITTNYRHIIEHKLEDYLKYLCEPAEFHERRVTVHFVCDRGISHEFVRHRVFSFAQESTRYCNYSKDKFGGEVTFIIPCWLNLSEGHYQYVHETGPLGHDFYWTPEVSYKDLENGASLFLETLAHSEVAYHELLNKWDNRVHDRRFRTGYKGNPWTPQQARVVLPNALKTELVMTGFADDWKHFFFLRCPVNAHPQARELAIPLSDEFNRRGYLK